MSNEANKRALARTEWLKSVLGKLPDILPLAGDASFRCYFRVQDKTSSRVLMDAPPLNEDVRPFLAVRTWMQEAGLRVPDLIAKNTSQGFVLLEDFGDTTWSVYLSGGHKPDALLEDGFRQLHLLQAYSRPGMALPAFDLVRMRKECDLYLDWYLPRVADHIPTPDECLSFYEFLMPYLDKIASLPCAPVHLDYHSRNLMLPEDGLPLGVIDFQDAVHGPVTYDLASLLYDCYQDYPESERLYWSRIFFEALQAKFAAAFSDFEAWHDALRLTAMQRHIKAIGIFARLAYRDGKQSFLKEIPLSRKHLLEELSFLEIDRAQIPLLFKQ
ncbi:MAG: aminoglycoside phosphotransferase family protein [Mariprofundaceae bacterium]